MGGILVCFHFQKKFWIQWHFFEKVILIEETLQCLWCLSLSYKKLSNQIRGKGSNIDLYMSNWTNFAPPNTRSSVQNREISELYP